MSQLSITMRSMMISKSVSVFLTLALFAVLASLTAQAVQYQTYTVKGGDTLYRISREFKVSVDEIKRLNNLTSNNLRIGQVLKIKPLENQARPSAREPTPVTPPQISAPTVTDPSQLRLPDDYYYIVKPQDNLYRISVNHNVKLVDMLKWNGFADDTPVVKPGDKIIVKDPSQYIPAEPPTEAVNNPPATTTPTASAQETESIVEKVHIVQPKETLYRIAKNHGMTVEEIKRLNNLTSNEIRVGQRLYLTPRRESPGDAPPKVEAAIDPEASDRIRTDLIMPVDGKVSSEFGIRNGRPHKGIDISAKAGTPIYAVLDGTVVFSGYQGAYGIVIVLEHPDFVMTVYAHNEKNLVSVGDQVTKGQIIGTVGSTGDASGPHVHFEYRIKGKAINPRKVLPFDLP